MFTVIDIEVLTKK